MGRPTEYQKKYDRMAYRHCLLGATDKDLAELFEVVESTINLWKVEHQSFSESIKKGKDDADQKVAESLYKRATGYSHPDTHISNYLGEIIETKIRKHYPPDTTACIFWLKNRRGSTWRDTKNIEHGGTATIKHDISAIPDVLKDMIRGHLDDEE